MKLRTNRLEALVDGVFAIVLTVLMLSFSEAFDLKDVVSEDAFYQLFASLGNDFFAYVICFLLLGVLWFEHHRQSHFIKHADSVSVFLSFLWLMFVTFLPFSTLMLGNHEKFIFPVFIFEMNILIVTIFLYIHWAYATDHHRLVDPALNRKVIVANRRVSGLCVLFPLIAVCLCPFFPLVSLLSLIGVPLLMVFRFLRSQEYFQDFIVKERE